MVNEICINDIKGIEIISGQITSRIEEKDESKVTEVAKVLIPKAIERGRVNHENLGTINISEELDSRRLTRIGDIVMKLSTPYESCLITEEDEGLLVPSFCVIFRLDESCKINKSYLVAFLNSKHCESQIKVLVSGATMPILSTGTVRKINVVIPEVKKQEQMGLDFIKTVSKEKLLKKIIELEYEKINSEIYEMME